MATSFPGRAVACLSLLLSGSAWTGAAHALCKPHNTKYPDMVPIASLPSITTLNHVGVGKVMADYEVHLILPNPNSVPSWGWCTSPSKEIEPRNMRFPLTSSAKA